MRHHFLHIMFMDYSPGRNLPLLSYFIDEEIESIEVKSSAKMYG